MRQIQSNSPTAEEFHYQFDGGGRMMAASFAMTPASGYTPSSGQPWYTATELPSTRARAVYDNSGGGQLLDLDYYWDSWNSSGSDYNSNGIYSYSYGYDPNTWLKTGATLDDFNPHRETYDYGVSSGNVYGLYNDYLVQATNAGNAGVTENWTFDPAGNRHDTGSAFGSWSFDNLNRLTASPGLTYSNDTLGNRLGNSVSTNGWDQLNRMTSFTSGSTTTNYSYRADGMRVLKSDNSGNSTSFAYDGQMGFEDNEPQGSSQGVTDYAIGARGVDRIAFSSGSGTVISYPVYDGHGNMACTLTASGESYNAANNERQYDAWGGIAYGQGSSDPKGRYCANLGHKQDDESGFVYMAARYYDPPTGRFTSEDPKQQHLNWFVYASNKPTSRSDASGKDDGEESAIFMAIMWECFAYDALGPASFFYENPWLKSAMDEFNGEDVPEKYQEELEDRLASNSCADYFSFLLECGISLAGEESSLGGELILGASLFEGAALAIDVAIAEATMDEIALVSCDMAFEDGM